MCSNGLQSVENLSIILRGNIFGGGSLSLTQLFHMGLNLRVMLGSDKSEVIWASRDEKLLHH